jgi:hypothetical protein
MSNVSGSHLGVHLGDRLLLGFGNEVGAAEAGAVEILWAHVVALGEPDQNERGEAVAPSRPAPGIVSSQAEAICPSTPQCTPARLRPRPEPVTPPETTCVVDRGYP